MSKKRHSADLLATVLLFCLFALTGASSLVLGARVWRSAQSSMEERFAGQTPLSYVAGKARQSDGVRLGRLSDGTEALLLDSVWDGEAYLTQLYCYDGALCELFTPADVALRAQDGAKVFEAVDMTFDVRDGMVRASCGGRQALLAPRRGEGARP
ncbi:MAG: DUF4860 domain-containing protein [Eubacteriales bacterium]|nr:DUF4860 domain-containing protein [Eubacteriales bacterium]